MQFDVYELGRNLNLNLSAEQCSVLDRSGNVAIVYRELFQLYIMGLSTDKAEIMKSKHPRVVVKMDLTPQ